MNAAAARYLLVGGYAVAFHAQPRFTKDLDVWTDPDPANATRVFEALRQIGAPLNALTAEDRAETTYGDQTLPVIGRRHLIQNKRASRRPQDLLDLEVLEGDGR